MRDLAEEIWTATSGFLPTVRPDGDPRSSRAGASAQTAYRRRREAERAAWRPGWAWRGWAVAGAALAVGLGIGLTVGAWLGWPMAMVASVLAWSRLRFRPSPGASVWKRYWRLTLPFAMVVSGTALLVHEQNGWLWSRSAFVHHTAGWTVIVGALFPLLATFLPRRARLEVGFALTVLVLAVIIFTTRDVGPVLP